MSVVDLNRFQEDRAAEAWTTYVRARDAAERSHDFRDGIAAGKAWRAFLTLFQSPEQTQTQARIDETLAKRRRG